MEADERFVQWYQAQHPRLVTSLTLATGDSDLAREATDEAFARALERWHRVGTMQSPTGWAYRVALNVARRRRRRPRRGHLPTPHEATTNLQPVDHELWAAVAKLPPRQRTAVALRYVADLPERAIADAMRVSAGTVAATLNAARKRLADDLAVQGVHHD